MSSSTSTSASPRRRMPSRHRRDDSPGGGRFAQIAGKGGAEHHPSRRQLGQARQEDPFSVAHGRLLRCGRASGSARRRKPSPVETFSVGDDLDANDERHCLYLAASNVVPRDFFHAIPMRMREPRLYQRGKHPAMRRVQRSGSCATMRWKIPKKRVFSCSIGNPSSRTRRSVGRSRWQPRCRSCIGVSHF